VNRRVYRRVQRTREALRDALLALLPELGWDDIDVQTLCERANIGRSTFYLHFPDKAALLRGTFDDLRAHLLQSGQHGGDACAYPFLPGLLAHVHEQRAVFQALLGRRSSQAVQAHFREVLVSLFSESIGLRTRAPWAAHARAHAMAGALFQLMVWWLGSRNPVSPAEVEAWFIGFAVTPQA
jgi:AcrR family transcriptional regulator